MPGVHLDTLDGRLPGQLAARVADHALSGASAEMAMVCSKSRTFPTSTDPSPTCSLSTHFRGLPRARYRRRGCVNSVKLPAGGR